MFGLRNSSKILEQCDYFAPIEDLRQQREEEEPDVQVRTDSSAWHRHALDGAHTACGQDLRALRFRGGSLRHESYRDELCRDGCFSPFELQLSHDLNAAIER